MALWSLFRRRVTFPYFTFYWSVKVRHPSHYTIQWAEVATLEYSQKVINVIHWLLNLPNFLLSIPQPCILGWEELSFLKLVPFPRNLLFMLFYISCLWIGKDPDAGKDQRQEKKWVTENEMIGWHHWLNEHEFEQTPGDSEGQGSLVCCNHGVAKSRTWLSNWAIEQLPAFWKLQPICMSEWNNKVISLSGTILRKFHYLPYLNHKMYI